MKIHGMHNTSLLRGAIPVTGDDQEKQKVLTHSLCGLQREAVLRLAAKL